MAALTVDVLKNATVKELGGAKNQQVCGKIEELQKDKQKKEGQLEKINAAVEDLKQKLARS